MGKSNQQDNEALNVSLSYTLKHLQTEVTLEDIDSSEDIYELRPDGPSSQILDLKSSQKFKNFVKVLKKEFNLESSNFKIKSVNDFPSDCGLASSASSLMALTEAFYKKYQDVHQKEKPLIERSLLSRKGSGSSCRSFFSPFALWDGDDVKALNLALKLHHMVIVIDKSPKAVSSSEAHKKVQSSLLLKDRPERARTRMAQLIGALKSDWRKAFEICWNEFWDMQVLFETSVPSFGYLQPESLKVLFEIRDSWNQTDDGPLVTMDAGPNIHLLFREDQTSLFHKNCEHWSGRYECYDSRSL